MQFTTLWIFLWKHYKSMRLTWVSALMNVGLPIGLTFLSMYLSQQVTNYRPPQSTDSEQAVDQWVSRHDELSQDTLIRNNPMDQIYYAPETPYTFGVIERVRKFLEIPYEQVHGFASEAAMVNRTRNQMARGEFGILFGDNFSAAQSNDNRYTIQAADGANFRTNDRLVGNFYDASMSSFDPYLYSGFITLQMAIDKAVLSARYGNQTDDVELSFQKMPSNIRGLAKYTPFVPFAIIALVIYMFSVVNMVVVPTVEEKALGIREFLRIATTHYELNLFSFYVLHVLLGGIIFGAILAFGQIYGMTVHFSTLCAMILILLFVASAIAYAFLVTVMFNTVFFAKNTGVLMLIVPWTIQFFDSVRFAMPLISSTLFTAGWTLFDEYGARAQVFGMSNIFEHVSTTIPYSMLEIWCMLAADTIVYVLLYTYLVQVFPGTYGTPQPFHFPVLRLMRLFRCGGGATPPDSLGGDQSNNGGIAEAGASRGDRRQPVVRVRGLTKDFGQLFGEKHRAVNNVDMDICANQITVLLGHNGAGKTTTMSIISGVIPKTSGEISVNGERDVNHYRKDIGYCPQHNVFLPYFTCMDHLIFFGVLRGLSKSEAREKSRALLDRLKLLPKANEYGKDLSGGMKRRLCLGIALIGDTKIAILDEPSSGLDPESRRELWNILIEMRKRNTIMITTHYMEEAETLADYISIMSRGEILCHGTAQQLKRRYADGYVLKLLTNEQFDTAKAMEVLHRHIPEAKVKSFVKPTLNVTLPYSHLDKYSEALAALEGVASQLGIVSFGLSNASLEEVFLNSDPQKHAPEAQDSQSQSYDQVDGNSYSPLNEVKYKQNCNLWTQQVIAIFYKKAVYVCRHWVRLLVCLAILVLAVGFGLRNPNDDSPAEHIAVRLADEIDFSPQTLRNGAILLHVDDVQNAQVQSFAAALKQLLNEINVNIHNLPSGGSLETALLDFEQQNILTYHEHIQLGLSIDQSSPANPLSVRILYSGNVLHSTARGLNLVGNVLDRMLNTVADGKGGAPMQLHTISHPVQERWHELFVETRKTGGSGQTFNTFLLVMPMALFFYMLYYAYMPFAETNTEFKQLQIIPPALYWTACYTFDAVQHLLICALLFGLHIAFDRMHALTPCEHGQLIGMYAMYGLAYLPLMYVVAQVFASLSSVYSFFSYMFIGATIPSFWFTLSFQTLHQYAGWIAVLFVLPDYAVRHSINVFVMLHTHKSIPQDDALVGMTRFYVYMSVVAIVALAFLVLVLEHIYRRDAIVRVLRLYRPILRALRCGKRTAGVQEQPMLSTTGPMEDVYGERDQTDAVVQAHKEADYAIVVTKLRKMYDGFVAVRGVDFAVRRGECFGLLGMNGAGKTTTFKMMVRQLPITEGAIYFNGLSSRAEESRYRYQFGYCPQADALNGWMTAYETLKYMGLARGMRWAELNGEVRRLMQNTDLAAYADVTVEKMSGGTKRKLNTAMAIQSDPLLVFLDEPTTGVDPSSRRFMWACIQECQRQNKNIVLTSHSMDECEFLCNRLAIMNHGQLNCIGPIQQLKRSFALGFLVTVQLRDGQAGTNGAAELRQTVLDRFQCVLREEYGNQLTFLAQNTNILWSEVFRGILAVQQQFDRVVEDISLSESSLEDIFLKIARDTHVDSPHAV